MNILLRNNTGNKGKSLLINGFVVRVKAFNNIFDEIKLSNTDKPEQNYLVIGQRGAGKTTLLYRLKYAIEDDPELNGTVIPVMFNEEQYNLTELLNLWENIAEYLDEFQGFEDSSKKIQSIITGGKYDEETAYEFLERQLKEHKKKIIVFIENIDTLFRKIGKDGQKRLREVLTTSPNLRVIGSATTYFDGIINYSDPFYDFFKVIQLNGLTKQESLKLITKLAEQSNELNKIDIILQRNPTRIEALRRLTGGNPRTMSYLYQIFLDNANGKAIKDLYRLLDDLTFLYKSELDQLSPQQQKVVDVIARNWDAISVKELTTQTKLLSKHVSSVLNTLEKNQVIESVATKTKNNLYRIKDRFLNIWYLMRFGRKRDKENIVWLVRFYDAWCDKSELSERVLHHINNIKGGEYDTIAALDMVNTFLSCKNLSPTDKYKLYKTTKSYLPKDLIRNLKLSKEVWFNTIKDLVKRKQFDQALDVLVESEVKDTFYYTFSYWIYFNKGEFYKAAESLEKIFEEKQDGLTAFTLADIFETKLSDVDNAIKYYEIALSKKHFKAAFRLGQVFYYAKDDYFKGIEYHELAISHNIDQSIMALATIYFSKNDFAKAKRLCFLAIEKGDLSAYNNLAILLQNEGEIDEAISVLEKAISLGEDYALVSLGNLYLSSGTENDKKAKSLFEQAVAKNIHDSHYALGKYLLRREKKIPAAINMLKEGIKHKDADAAHLLAHHYHEVHDWNKAEKWFLESVKLGKRSSLICLAECAFVDGRDERKAFILEQFQSLLSPFSQPIVLLEYCKVLLWNDRIDESIHIVQRNEAMIQSALDNDTEEYKEEIITEFTNYIIRLLAKYQFNAIKDLFKSEVINYKQLLKPVYYALMNFQKDEYPNEYLKAGSELDETINEIINAVEKVRKISRHEN